MWLRKLCLQMHTKGLQGDEGARKSWNGRGMHAAASPATVEYKQSSWQKKCDMLLTVMMQLAAETLGALSPEMRRENDVGGRVLKSKREANQHEPVAQPSSHHTAPYLSRQPIGFLAARAQHLRCETRGVASQGHRSLENAGVAACWSDTQPGHPSEYRARRFELAGCRHHVHRETAATAAGQTASCRNPGLLPKCNRVPSSGMPVVFHPHHWHSNWSSTCFDVRVANDLQHDDTLHLLARLILSAANRRC